MLDCLDIYNSIFYSRYLYIEYKINMEDINFLFKVFIQGIYTLNIKLNYKYYQNN